MQAQTDALTVDYDASSIAKLRNSTFGTDGCLSAIAVEFDKTAKKRFKGTGDATIKFSHNLRDTDAAVGIRNGRIKLSE